MHVKEKLKALLNQLNTVIVGKTAHVSDCVACLLAGGHLLIEDVPGVGKTTLAHGVLNWTPTDHWGYTDDTGVMMKVTGGEFKVEK